MNDVYPELRGFLDKLASTDPVPAGGAAAAMSGAMGAALTAKIAGICLARSPEEAVRTRLDEVRARSIQLHERLHALIGEDCAAFQEALASRDRLDDAATRDAYLRACEPPRQIALHGAEAAELAVEVLGRAPKATRTDAAKSIKRPI